ncbi:hypothetical protein JNO48_12920 [Clostridiales bacterium]|nr:hypothetical protein JNO48_12920 [Clostridiales bacterium]
MNRQDFLNRYNHLAAQFLRSLTTQTPGENIVFSPFSIISILSILADAANGKTREEILQVLCGSMNPEGLPEQLQKTQKELTKIDFANITAYENPFGSSPVIPDYSRHLDTANAVFVRDDIQNTFNPAFGNYFADTYDGTLMGTNNVEAAMEAWFNAMEHGRLELPKNTTPSDTILALANTVLFEAMWLAPYTNSQVKKRVFTNSDNTKARVNMMYSTENNYIETDLATGFIKDFQQCDYSFAALLPKAKRLEALQQLISATNFQRLQKRSTYAIVHTAMPEFTIETETNIKQTCADLGITEALTTNADLSTLTTAKHTSKQIIHKAKIELDRNGAKAKAATAIHLLGSLPPDEEKEVILNRPFVFAILHRTMNIPVFMGIVNRMKDA